MPMEQLVFELVVPEPPTFANFVEGGNAEAVARLAAAARGETRDTSIVLWGASGGGRSHLLRAAVAASVRPATFTRMVSAVISRHARSSSPCTVRRPGCACQPEKSAPSYASVSLKAVMGNDVLPDDK